MPASSRERLRCTFIPREGSHLPMHERARTVITGGCMCVFVVVCSFANLQMKTDCCTVYQHYGKDAKDVPHVTCLFLEHNPVLLCKLPITGLQAALRHSPGLEAWLGRRVPKCVTLASSEAKQIPNGFNSQPPSLL